MAAKIVSQGLQRIGKNASFIGTTPGNVSTSLTRYIMTMSADDSAVAFAAGDTAQNSGGAVTNSFDQLLDATPTISSQTVSHVCTFGTGNANFTVKRLALHDDTATNVTTSSTTLVGGVDGQSLTKTSSFSLAVTMKINYVDAS